MGLTTYLLFDLYMELAKRKVIPSKLEVEIGRIREALVRRGHGGVYSSSVLTLCRVLSQHPETPLQT
jgi:hypothetical protein